MVNPKEITLGKRVKIEFWGEVMGIDQRRVEVKPDGCSSGVWAVIGHSEVKETLDGEGD